MESININELLLLFFNIKHQKNDTMIKTQSFGISGFTNTENNQTTPIIVLCVDYYLLSIDITSHKILSQYQWNDNQTYCVGQLSVATNTITNQQIIVAPINNQTTVYGFA